MFAVSYDKYSGDDGFEAQTRKTHCRLYMFSVQSPSLLNDVYDYRRRLRFDACVGVVVVVAVVELHMLRTTFASHRRNVL